MMTTITTLDGLRTIHYRIPVSAYDLHVISRALENREIIKFDSTGRVYKNGEWIADIRRISIKDYSK